MFNFPSPYERTLPKDIRIVQPPNYPSNDQTLSRVIGSIVGLAVGDALGAHVEFRPRQYLLQNPVSDMQGGGTWGLKAGQWTDDTSMALCLAASLITKKGFDPYNQMVHYKWWYKHGFLSSTGQCFDIGNATRQSLDEFCRRQNLLKKHFHCRTEEEVDQLQFESIQSLGDFDVNCSSSGVAGNGALMRLTPVPLFYFRSPVDAVKYAGLSAVLTHGDQKAADACRYYAALIAAAVKGTPKEEFLSDTFYTEHQDWFGTTGLHPEVLRVAKGSYKKSGGYDAGIRGKGYIVQALEAALWAFWSDGNSFEKGVLAAVNLGDDADTTAAIYGQLAGACYGYQAIPKNWRDKLYAHDLLVCIGCWLHFLGSHEHSHQHRSQVNQNVTKPSTLHQSPSGAVSSGPYPLSRTFTDTHDAKYDYGARLNKPQQEVQRRDIKMDFSTNNSRPRQKDIGAGSVASYISPRASTDGTLVNSDYRPYEPLRQTGWSLVNDPIHITNSRYSQAGTGTHSLGPYQATGRSTVPRDFGYDYGSNESQLARAEPYQRTNAAYTDTRTYLRSQNEPTQTYRHNGSAYAGNPAIYRGSERFFIEPRNTNNVSRPYYPEKYY